MKKIVLFILFCWLSVETAKAQCAITSIVVLPTTTCNDNGTPLVLTDDFYQADVTVNFVFPITVGGSLDIFGSASFNSIPDFFLVGLTSYTFFSVNINADGTPGTITAMFTGGPCMFTQGGIPAVGPCGASTACVFTLAPTSTNITCNGAGDGTANATVSSPGGCTYNWSGGLGATSSLTGLDAGTYTCTVTNPAATGSVSTLFFDDFDGVPMWTTPGISIGFEDVDANIWIIDALESWDGVCGSGNIVIAGDKTLHVYCNSFFCGFIGTGAIYDASIGGPTATSKIAPMTAGVSTVGFSNITLNFNWRAEGEFGTDRGFASYSIDGGTSWTNLPTEYSGQSLWQCESVVLPATCAGIADLRVGFYWENDVNGVGVDPAFAIDDVTITGETAGSACDTTMTFTITEPSNLTVNAGLDQNICPTASATLTATSTGGTGLVGYVWNPGAINTASISISPADTQSYTVVVTDANGCTAQDIANVFVSPLTCCTFTTTNPPAVCFGSCVDITNAAYSTVSEPGTFLYFSAAGCIGSQLPNPTQVCVSGTYYIQFLSFTGCIICQPITVTINPGGQGNITTNDTLYCNQNQNFALAATPPGGIFDGPGVTPAGVFNPTAAGLGYHAIVYDLSSFGSCASNDTLIVHVINAPEPAFSVPDTICKGVPVTIFYTGETANVSEYEFDFDGGTVVNGALSGPYRVFWNTSGTKNIELTITAGVGCQVVTTEQVDVEYVDVNTIESTTIAIGDEIQLLTTGVPAVGYYNYVWNPNPTLNCDSCQNPLVSPIEDQQYIVTIYDINGCKASDTVTIYVEVDRSVFIPNSFTPNDDQVNDVFEVYGLNTSSFTLSVYNRWGEKVFEQTDQNPKWDGRFKGKVLDSGVYVYVINTKYLDNVERYFTGNITLIK